VASEAGDLHCLHFFSCVAVFAGDPKLSKEFSRFIAEEKVHRPARGQCYDFRINLAKKYEKFSAFALHNIVCMARLCKNDHKFGFQEKVAEMRL
jgi:hypothetical protein